MVFNFRNKKNRVQRKGSIVIIAIIFMMFLSISILSVTVMLRTQAKDVSRDVHRNGAFYVANGGLELVYSAILDDRTGGSLITRLGEKTAYMNDDVDCVNPVMKSDNLKMTYNTKSLGYVDLAVYTQNIDGTWYFRVVSRGSDLPASERQTVTDSYVMTMYISKNDPTNPLIYDGDINQLK